MMNGEDNPSEIWRNESAYEKNGLSSPKYLSFDGFHVGSISATRHVYEYDRSNKFGGGGGHVPES
jgi:hypothetical protein